MKLSPSESRVKRFLCDIGFTVIKLHERVGHKIADFQVTDTSENTYIIEVKSQAEDLVYLQELSEKGEVFRKDEVLRTNVATRVIREAVDQIRATPSPEKSSGVIAIVVAPDDPGTQVSEFVSTLYGTRFLVLLDNDGEAGSIECYYFDYNEFFTTRDIEAVIIFSDYGCRLYINTFAKKLVEFRETDLFHVFEEKNAIIDPEIIEQAGAAYIANTDLDRKDEEKLIDYIISKYSLHQRPVAIRPTQLRYAKRVDDRGN